MRRLRRSKLWTSSFRRAPACSRRWRRPATGSAGCVRNMSRGRPEQGWESVVVERDGRRVGFKVPPGMPSVDPSALVLMNHRN
jgi:hypothetical protein